MRRKRSNFEYEAAMAADCDRAFRDALSMSHAYDSVLDVAQLAVTLPAERCWVSEPQAYKVISRIARRGVGAVGMMIRSKSRLYMYIWRRVSETRGANESLKDAVYRVCGEGAPEMFMSPRTLLVKMSRWRKKGKI